MNFDFNFSKKSGTYIDGEEKFIYKFYLNTEKKNIKNSKLINEYRGNYWYLSKIRYKRIRNLQIIKKPKKFNLIKMPYFNGTKYKFWNNFLGNKKEIFLVLNHYKKIWPKNNKIVPYHGDLTLSNIIFNDGKVRIIDWENFEKDKLWGLDICYFILSLIILPSISKKTNKLLKNSADNFVFIWKSFFKNYDFEYLNDPVYYLKKNTNLQKNNFLNLISKNLKKEINFILNETNK